MIQILPTEQHYHSISRLKESIKEHYDYFDLPMESQDIKRDFFKPYDNTFEVVLNSRKKKLLIPEDTKYPFLYRGQREDWPLCPTLYRTELNISDIFLERLRLAEFQILLNSHPIVKHFFKKHNIHVDSIGLAQHYGLKTEALDFTNDLDIALFFAVCIYDNSSDSYLPFTGEEARTGFLHVTVPSLSGCFNDNVDLFDKRLNIIGMQPFARPGQQKGFAYYVTKNNPLNTAKYSFTYTKEDSHYYFNKFKGGKSLWINDILADKTNLIAIKKEFSIKTFNKACDNYLPKGISKRKMLELILNSNTIISTHIDNIMFTDSECVELIEKWNNKDNIKNIIFKIRRKFWNEMLENQNKDLGPRHNFRTTTIIQDEEIIRLLCNQNNIKKEPHEQQSKTNIPTFTSPKNRQNFKSGKVSGKYVLAKSESFLTENDCQIKLKD